MLVVVSIDMDCGCVCVCVHVHMYIVRFACLSNRCVVIFDPLPPSNALLLRISEDYEHAGRLEHAGRCEHADRRKLEAEVFAGSLFVSIKLIYAYMCMCTCT